MAKRSSGKKGPLYKLHGNERRQRIEIWPTGMIPRTGTRGMGPVNVIIGIIIESNYYYYYYSMCVCTYIVLSRHIMA
jgi:hypothetical protein